MKKIVLMAAAATLALAGCTKDGQTASGKDEPKPSSTRMTLVASVDGSDSKATIGGTSEWQFSFEQGDVVKVNNTEHTSGYYTFTKGAGDFESSDAETTTADATWYAYFPSESITLTGQAGTKDDAADHFGYAGKTDAKAGDKTLSMTLSPQMAILEIENQIGEIDLCAKSGDNYITGVTASLESGVPSFAVSTDTNKSSLLTATKTGTYYVAVPAGVALSFYEGTNLLTGSDCTTSTFTLMAGKHYKLIVPLTLTFAVSSSNILVDEDTKIENIFSAGGDYISRFTDQSYAYYQAPEGLVLETSLAGTGQIKFIIKENYQKNFDYITVKVLSVDKLHQGKLNVYVNDELVIPNGEPGNITVNNLTSKISVPISSIKLDSKQDDVGVLDKFMGCVGQIKLGVSNTSSK